MTWFRVFGAPAGERRIFRVDKHKVPEYELPDEIRKIQSVRFYREGYDAKCVDEFFWGGKVRLSREYDKALLELTSVICKRLEELGIPHQPQDQPEPQVDDARPSNGRAKAGWTGLKSELHLCPAPLNARVATASGPSARTGITCS
jgi:hypothetical protein